jgi:hypothetical protein
MLPGTHVLGAAVLGCPEAGGTSGPQAHRPVAKAAAPTHAGAAHFMLIAFTGLHFATTGDRAKAPQPNLDNLQSWVCRVLRTRGGACVRSHWRPSEAAVRTGPIGCTAMHQPLGLAIVLTDTDRPPVRTTIYTQADESCAAQYASGISCDRWRTPAAP